MCGRWCVPHGRVVAVFGASNFPLAYGVCGGDTASALAAGCAVVVKEHPAHPRTGRLIADIVRAAIVSAGADAGILGYLEHTDPADFSIPQRLVNHPDISAVGFTGSTKGGRALEDLARKRERPIPVFAEMGSMNPVFVTQAAISTRAQQIADELADSVFARFGQQCTKPGVIFVENKRPSAMAFTDRLRERFLAGPTREMLAPWIAKAYGDRIAAIATTDSQGRFTFFTSKRDQVSTQRLLSSRLAQCQLLLTTMADWLSFSVLREEIFGPCLICVRVEDWADALKVRLAGHLALSVFFNDSDEADVVNAFAISSAHSSAAGRVVFNGVPTGVRVCESMVHGGPFPSTNAPHTTAVGPRAIERWCRPVAFQNCPDTLLPQELRDINLSGSRVA